MRILYHFRTRGTGAEAVHIAGIANAFAQLGHEVFFSSPTGVDPRETAGADPYRDARGGWVARFSRRLPGFVFELLEIGYNAAAYRRTARMLRETRADLIYERHAFFLFATALLARRRGVPLVIEVNELVGDERVRVQPWFQRLAAWCDRFAFRRATLIVVVSPHLQRRIEAQGIAAEKILVLPNAVARDEVATPADCSAVRARLPAAALTIGFVGWLVEWHRLDFLIDVLGTIVPAHPGAVLVLAGDGALRAELEERAARRGVRAIFMGTKSHREMPACIAAMDICVVPHSNAYRSPIKLFEYMSQARPVVAPRTEPIAAVIEHGKNGLLFEPLDAAGLRAELLALITNPQLRETLGRQARESVLKKHTWESNAGRILERLGQSSSSR